MIRKLLLTIFLSIAGMAAYAGCSNCGEWDDEGICPDCGRGYSCGCHDDLWCDECGACQGNGEGTCGDCYRGLECGCHEGYFCESCGDCMFRLGIEPCDNDSYCWSCHYDNDGMCLECGECQMDDGLCPFCHRGITCSCDHDGKWCYDCGDCFYDNLSELCEYCQRCGDCQVDANTHCCFCDECIEGGGDFCENHNSVVCISCAVANDWHCPMCEGCFKDVGECTCESTEHCLECSMSNNWLCEEGCGKCYADDPDKICEYCRMCEECWVANMNHCCICAKCIESGDDFCNAHDETICVECAVDQGHHCPLCQGCYEDFGMCEDGGEHCLDCCYNENWLCVNCGVCIEATGIGKCETCGWCDYCFPEAHCYVCGACPEDVAFCTNHSDPVCMDCALDEGLHCPLCETCYEDEDQCQSGGEHCTNCCENNSWLCIECGVCTEAEGIGRCDECELCENCLMDPSVMNGYDILHCLKCGINYHNDEDEICLVCGICSKCYPIEHKCPYCDNCCNTSSPMYAYHNYYNRGYGIREACEEHGMCIICCTAHNPGITINSENFPDEMLREYVLSYDILQKDSILSLSEQDYANIKNNFHTSSYWSGALRMRKDTLTSLNGLNLFNCKTINVSDTSHYVSSFSNSWLTDSLKTLKLRLTDGVTKFNLGHIDNLDNLTLYGGGMKILLLNNKTIKTIEIEDSPVQAVDLSGVSCRNLSLNNNNIGFVDLSDTEIELPEKVKIENNGIYLDTLNMYFKFSDIFPGIDESKIHDVEGARKVEKPITSTDREKLVLYVLGYWEIETSSNISGKTKIDKTGISVPKITYKYKTGNTGVEDPVFFISFGKMSKNMPSASTTGIDAPVAGEAFVYTEGRTIYVTGVEGDIYVYAANGTVIGVVNNATAVETNAIEVAASGVYVVKTASYSKNVVVK